MGNLPLLRAGRPLKRWRYVGVFCEELMACAALVQVGPARQSFWAMHMRAGAPPASGTSALGSVARTGGRMRERTRMRSRGAVELPPGRMIVRDGGVRLDLAMEEDAGIQALCQHGKGKPSRAVGWELGGWELGVRRLGAGEVWTRKQAGVRAYGTLSLDGGAERAIEALAVIDDTAGYHARQTEWWWSAGVGVSEEGAPLAWNLVRGVNDPPRGSERAVWIAGEPHETASVRFAADLSEIVADDGARVSFTAEAVRRRSENLLIVSSSYTAPFGTFSGTLPGGTGLASGLGVMEHHRAKW